MRGLAVVALALILAGCQAPPPASQDVEAGGLSVSFGDVAMLEAVDGGGATVQDDGGVSAVVVYYDVANHEAQTVAADDFPVVQIFDAQGGAYDADMVFTPDADGQLTNDWPADLAAGATLHAAAVFSVRDQDWASGVWTAGWRGSTTVERTVISLRPVPLPGGSGPP